MVDFHDPLSSNLPRPGVGPPSHSRWKLQSTPCGHGHSPCFMPVLLPIHSWVACHHPKAFRGSLFPLHRKQMVCTPFKALHSLYLPLDPATPFPECLPPSGHASTPSLAPTTPRAPHPCASAYLPQHALSSPQTLSRPYLKLKGASSPPSTGAQRSPQQLP